MIVAGHQIRGQYWAEGAGDWTDAGVCELPTPAEGRPKLSLHAYNGFADREHWARITEFKVVRRTK